MAQKNAPKCDLEANYFPLNSPIVKAILAVALTSENAKNQQLNHPVSPDFADG